jgi:hypothetical protein
VEVLQHAQSELAAELASKAAANQALQAELSELKAAAAGQEQTLAAQARPATQLHIPPTLRRVIAALL